MPSGTTLSRFGTTYYKNAGVNDTRQAPIPNATVNVYKQGCTVQSIATVTTSAAGVSVTVNAAGRVALADIVQQNVDSTKTMEVVEITSDTSIKLKSLIGQSIALSVGDRLVITSNQPTLYSESSGSSAAANPITADANGNVEFYSKEAFFDVIVTGSGVTPTLYPNSQSGIPVYSANVKHYGAIGNASADDTAAFVAALRALPTTGGKLIVPDGRYYITQTIVLDKIITMEGTNHRVVEGGTPPCEIIKGAAMTTNALTVTAAACTIRDISFQGEAGNSGPGIVIEAGRVGLYNVCVFDMGGNGINVGGDGAGSGFSGNVNLWRMDRVTSRSNGGHGVYMRAINGANAGCATLLSCQENSLAGLYIAEGNVNTFVGTHTEDNGDEGIFITGNSDRNSFYGGDQEGNDAGGSNIQVRIGTTGTPNQNAFIYCGIDGQSAGYSEAGATNPRTIIMESSFIRFGVNSSQSGTEWLSNGPNGGLTGGSGSYMSLYAASTERIRIGAADNGPNTAVTPGQLMYDVNNNRITLASRSNANHKVRLTAGNGLTSYAELDDANGATASRKLTTNCNVEMASSAWNVAHLILGSYHLWVDGSGKLRIKSSAPASDGDGDVVGTQT